MVTGARSCARCTRVSVACDWALPRSLAPAGLLGDDVSTYLGGRANLANLFSVFDFYLSVGLKPIFELSFMPEVR